MLVMKQYEITDFAKVGKTPSFGGINIKPFFKQKDVVSPHDSFLLNQGFLPFSSMNDQAFMHTNTNQLRQMIMGG
jgi:hypothetical protein